MSTDEKNKKSLLVGADDVLAQRETDLTSFLQRKQQIDALIKMMAKVTESITGERNGDLSMQPGVCGTFEHFLFCHFVDPVSSS